MSSSPTITLVDPEGTSLDVGLVGVGTRAGLPSATFTLDAKAWERVESDGLLHADPSRSSGLARPFDPKRSIEVEAVLDPVAAIDGADGLLDRMLVAAPGDALLSTEAWWALSATQEVELPPEMQGTGTLEEGIAFEHPSWLQGDQGSVGIKEAWNRAMEELGEHLEDSSPTPMLDLVQSMFIDNDFHVERPDADATILRAPVESDDGTYDLWIRTDEDKELLTVFAVLGAEVPEGKVADVQMLAAHLNGQLAVGSFEVSPDGILSYKLGIDVRGDDLSLALARNLVGHALELGARALQPLAEVLAGTSPSEAALLFVVIDES